MTLIELLHAQMDCFDADPAQQSEALTAFYLALDPVVRSAVDAAIGALCGVPLGVLIAGTVPRTVH